MMTLIVFGALSNILFSVSLLICNHRISKLEKELSND